MAGDWFMFRNDLLDDPAVLLLATDLKIDVDSVIGKLCRFWSWVDRHCSTEKLDGLSVTSVDGIVKRKGFTDAMVKVGWLAGTESDGYIVPNYERWFSKSAKKRALTARRVANYRQRKKVTDVTQAVTPVTLHSRGEKSKKRKPPLPPLEGGDVRGVFIEYFFERKEPTTSKVQLDKAVGLIVEAGMGAAALRNRILAWQVHHVGQPSLRAFMRELDNPAPKPNPLTEHMKS